MSTGTHAQAERKADGHRMNFLEDLAERTDQLSQGKRAGVVFLLAIALWAAVIVPTFFVLCAVAEHIHFFGETSTAEDVARSIRYAQISCISGLAIALVGYLTSFSLRQRAAKVFFILVASLSICVGLIGSAQSAPRTSQLPPAVPSHCVDRSGGDTVCPGG